MSDIASNRVPEFDGIVNQDGTLTVSREQIAALGLPVGSHLTLVQAPKRQSIKKILDENAAWQKKQGIEISEEEAERIAVEASRDIRRRLTEQARKGG